MNKLFQAIAQRAAAFAGSPLCFLISLVFVISWSVWSLSRHFDNMSQILGNSTISVFTLFLVLLVQNTQNRDMKALHIKLDEIIKAQPNARNKMIDAENLSDQDLDNIAKEFKTMDKVQQKVEDVEERVEHVEEDVDHLKKDA